MSETPAPNSPLQANATDARLMRSATYASVTVATLLIIVKVMAWLMTGSVAILATLVDSILDAAASVVNMFAVRHALEPADKDHRFGHGKAEPLAGLAQAALIGGSAVFLLFQAVERLINPEAVAASDVGIIVMVISIGLTLVLVLFQKFVVRKTKSVAISADSLHYQGDLLVNAGVIAALLLGDHLGWVWADGAFALAIAGYILWNALEIVRESLDLLMDKEFPPEDRARIHEIAIEHPLVSDIHDLRTRSTGPHKFIQFHLELEGDMMLSKAHAIADKIMYRVEAAFPGSEVLIHQDPEGVKERRATFK
ncbi:cation diffusion facilitator family transporter [Magnetospira sp. QH-2]|uniref:cation diffusion facilitator family transporter n=1 Tax=Magnetospira sp. (strain QH-2) TaxID=1288970 RepID=UPI000A4EBCFA|nr:cation diffusion facilitator family transporter [Magnetospira sp. QH-2]